MVSQFNCVCCFHTTIEPLELQFFKLTPSYVSIDQASLAHTHISNNLRIHLCYTIFSDQQSQRNSSFGD